MILKIKSKLDFCELTLFPRHIDREGSRHLRCWHRHIGGPSTVVDLETFEIQAMHTHHPPPFDRGPAVTVRKRRNPSVVRVPRRTTRRVSLARA